MVTIYLNASALKTLACPRRWYFTVRQGLVPKKALTNFAFGHAVHGYNEAVVRGTPPAQAIMTAMGHKGVDQSEVAKIMPLCMSFTPPTNVVMTEHGPAVELYFEHEHSRRIINDEEVRIVNCGTLDLIRRDNAGWVNIVDYKTTRLVTPDSAFARYDNDVQFRYYDWAVWKFGYEFLPLDVHNLARDGKLASCVCVGFMNARPPCWKYGKMMQFSVAQREEFDGMMNLLAEGIYKWWQVEDPPKTGWVNNACKDCDFTSLCDNEDSIAAQYLELLFERREYNPSKFRDHDQPSG